MVPSRRAATESLLTSRKVPVRVVENLTAMLLGVHLFEEFAKACGCELPHDLARTQIISAEDFPDPDRSRLGSTIPHRNAWSEAS